MSAKARIPVEAMPEIQISGDQLAWERFSGAKLPMIGATFEAPEPTYSRKLVLKALGKRLWHLDSFWEMGAMKAEQTWIQ